MRYMIKITVISSICGCHKKGINHYFCSTLCKIEKNKITLEKTKL